MQLSKWNPFKFTRKKSDKEAKAEKPAPAAAKAPEPAPAAITPAFPSDWMKEFFQAPAWLEPWRSQSFFPFENLERWFGDFTPSSFRPSIDVIDEGNALRITCDLPGLEDKDVKVTVDDGYLTISGEKKLETKSEKEGCYRLERAYGSFRRVLPLPSDVRRDGIEATMAKGVLTVKIPKAATTTPTERSIPVNAS
jgi:HSP20 family protein